jgi:hypothetical protein
MFLRRAEAMAIDIDPRVEVVLRGGLPTTGLVKEVRTFVVQYRQVHHNEVPCEVLLDAFIYPAVHRQGAELRLYLAATGVVAFTIAIQVLHALATNGL